jgi:HEAT repeat protein
MAPLVLQAQQVLMALRAQQAQPVLMEVMEQQAHQVQVSYGRVLGNLYQQHMSADEMLYHMPVVHTSR